VRGKGSCPESTARGRRKSLPPILDPGARKGIPGRDWGGLGKPPGSRGRSKPRAAVGGGAADRKIEVEFHLDFRSADPSWLSLGFGLEGPLDRVQTGNLRCSAQAGPAGHRGPFCFQNAQRASRLGSKALAHASALAMKALAPQGFPSKDDTLWRKRLA